MLAPYAKNDGGSYAGTLSAEIYGLGYANSRLRNNRPHDFCESVRWGIIDSCEVPLGVSVQHIVFIFGFRLINNHTELPREMVNKICAAGPPRGLVHGFVHDKSLIPGGSNKHTDRIEATTAMCELIQNDYIATDPQLNSLGCEAFCELVKNAMLNKGQPKKLFHVSEARNFFRNSSALEEYRRGQGRPRNPT